MKAIHVRKVCLCFFAVLAISCHGELEVAVDGVTVEDLRMPGDSTPTSETPRDEQPGRIGDLEMFGDLDTYSRLTKQEYRYVIFDLLEGLDQGTVARVLVKVEDFQENNYTGFYKNYNPITVAPGLELAQFGLAKSLAAGFVTSGRFDTLCETSCFDGVADQLLPQIWRRRLAEDERAQLRVMYDRFPEESQDYLLMVRVFASPFFHYKMFTPWPEDADLANIQRGQKLALLLTGSFPDDELQAVIDDGTIADKAVTEEHIRRLLALHPERFARLFVPQWLGVGSLAEAQDEHDGVPLRSMMVEPASIFADILKNGEPVSKLIALNHDTRTGPLAELYDADAIPSFFATAAFTYLTVDHETNNPSPIRRGSYIVNHLLCRNLQFPSSDAQEAVDRIVAAAPENQSPPERMAYFRSYAVCAGCHDQFDFYGLALEEMGAYGDARDSYYTGDAIDVGGSVGEISFETSVEFSNKLAETIELNTCFASQVYSYATSESHLTSNREFTKVESALIDRPVAEIVVEMMLTALGETDEE